jgi:hypothetical protein
MRDVQSTEPDIEKNRRAIDDTQPGVAIGGAKARVGCEVHDMVEVGRHDEPRTGSKWRDDQ